MKLRSALIAGFTTSSILFSPLASLAESTPPFTDINVGSPYLVQINFLREQGIVTGYDDQTFRPQKLINRAEAAALLKKALMADIQSKTSAAITFTDVPKNTWVYPILEELAAKHIINGKAKEFRPTDTINLAEAVKMVIMTEQLHNPEIILPTDNKSAFKDMKGTEWFAPYMQLANSKTLLTYSTKMNIVPDQNMTRGAFADLIYRALKTRQPGHFFGRGTFYSDSFEGLGTSNGEKYRMNEYTAANKTLPFGTKLKVTYLRNNQSVTVRVNDRGPFTPSLDLDMSRRAFTDLANPSEGIIPIEYEIIKDEPATLPATGGGSTEKDAIAAPPKDDQPITPEAPPKK